MVMVGGVTRLTGSGLSITEWKPIMGAIPPLSQEQWETAFAQYRQIPQYQLLNSGMTLSQFKFIFFWEYFHRLLGRVIGLAYFMPWALFALRGAFSRALNVKLLIGLALGGLQGALGWFMVKSGLSDRVYVSQYRLAAHLGLALFVLSYLFWLVLSLRSESNPDPSSSRTPHHAGAGLRTPLKAITALLCIQIFWGALVAGLKAGFGYNTFPTMNGDWFPRDFLQVQPTWLNFFEGHAGVQFAHRTLGWLLVFSISALWWRTRRENGLSSRQRSALNALFGMTLLQFMLGAATIIWMVPLPIAALHQLGACALLLITVWSHFELRGGHATVRTPSEIGAPALSR